MTNKTLKVGHETYNLRNITKTGIYTIKPTYIVTIKGMTIAFIIGMILVSIDNGTAKLFGIIIFAIGILGIVERLMKKNRYGLQLETAAGSKTVVSSPDKEFMGQVIDKIHEVMEREDVAANYTINMQDKSIKIDGNVSGTEFHNY